MSAEGEIGVIAFCAEFGTADVPKLDDGAVLGLLDDDSLEFLWIGEASGDAHTEVVEMSGGDRGLADWSGGDLDVLFGEGAGDVLGGESALGETNRVEPEAHGVLALTEDRDVAHAGNAFERVPHIDIKIVGDEERIVAIVREKRLHRRGQRSRSSC